MQALKRESEKRISVFERQMATATVESKAALERRVAEVRLEYQRRIQRLEEALDHRQAEYFAV
jgi:hypothetical protein